MLKLKDLDATKNYIRVLGTKTCADGTVMYICYCYTFGIYQLCKEKYELLISREDVQIIGPTYTGEYTEHCIKSTIGGLIAVSISENTLSVVVVPKRKSDKLGIRELTVRNGDVYEEYMKYDKKAKDASFKIVSNHICKYDLLDTEYVVDFNKCEDLQPIRLLVPTGVEIKDSGRCEILNKNLKSMFISEGIRSVVIKDSHIEELTLPKSCKEVVVDKCKIGAAYMHWACKVTVIACTIEELYISNNLRKFKTDMSRTSKIRKIIGEFKLFSRIAGIVEGITTDTVLDFSECIYNDMMIIANANCPMLILPNCIERVRIITSCDIGRIRISGKLKELGIEAGLELGTIFELGEPPSSDVGMVLSKFGLEWHLIEGA